MWPLSLVSWWQCDGLTVTQEILFRCNVQKLFLAIQCLPFLFKAKLTSSYFQTSVAARVVELRRSRYLKKPHDRAASSERRLTPDKLLRLD